MSSASNVARVGRLAVALGLGAAVATGHGVAAADYRTVIKTFPLDPPNGVAASRDGSRIYVSHEFSGQEFGNTVSVIDGATYAVVDTIVVGAKPGAMAVSPDGSRVYITNGSDHTVSVIVR